MASPQQRSRRLVTGVCGLGVAVDVVARQGVLCWRVVRDDEVVWVGECARGRLAQHATFPAVVGQWRLEWTTRGFSGDAKVALDARGE